MNSDEPDITELLVDKEELEVLSAQLLSYQDKVIEYPNVDWTPVTQDIQEKISLSDGRKRQVNIALKKLTNTVM